MSDSQIAVSAESLAHLPPALRRFRQFVPGHLSQVRGELRAIREALARAQYAAEARVSALHSEIRSADEDTDTSWLEDELEEAQAEQARCRHAERQLQGQLASFEQHAARLARLADHNIPRADQFLARTTTALEELRAIRFDDASGGGAMESHPGPESATPASIDTVAAIGMSGNGTIDLSSHPLPAGFCWVKLEEMNLDEALREVQGPADFRSHASYETMQQGLRTLHDQVLPAIARRGYSADGFYFQREDRRAGQDYEHGTQRVFDAFFGSDSIAVQRNPANGKYDIINGRHRIRAAADAHWLAVPIKICGGGSAQ